MKILLVSGFAMFAIACAESDVEPVPSDGSCASCGTQGGKSDAVEPARIDPVALEGPGLRCVVAAGDSEDPDFRRDSLACSLTSESGFQVTEVSLGGPSSPFQIALVNGDTSQLSGLQPVSVAEFAAISYPISFSAKIGYTTTAIVGRGGKTASLRTAAICDFVLNGPDDGEILCGGDAYELWLVDVVPDEEVAAGWDAGEFGAAAFSAGLIVASPSPQLCFPDGPGCTASASTNASWGYNDTNKFEGEVYFLVPAQSPDLFVTLAARVPSNSSVQPAQISGPGTYVLNAYGVLAAPL